MADFNPSSVEIIKAELISYDKTIRRNLISSFIGRFEITQSMDRVAYSGWLYILDNAGILEGMPIRGEETLNLWLKGMDLGTEVKISAVIHKVTDIVPNSSSNGVTYKLHFISKTSFKASTRKITQTHTNPVSVMAKDIFNSFFTNLGPGSFKHLKDDRRNLPFYSASYPLIAEKDEPERKFIIQPTENVANILIPRLSPTEAMYFIASRGYNEDTPSQSFRFFETLENYYFCTDEYFIKSILDKDVIKMFYAPVASYDATSSNMQINRIETIQVISKGIDTSTDLYSGSYRNEVVEIDLIRRRLDTTKFNFDDATYIDMSGTPRNNDSNPHTEQFRNDNFSDENAKRFMIFRNYTRAGDGPTTLNRDEHLSQIVQNRVSYYHHLNNTSLIVSTKGRLDIRPGMILDLDIKTLDGVSANVNTNLSLSGRYLVQTITHSRDNEGTLNTQMKIAKFDWSAPSRTTVAESLDIPYDPVVGGA